MKRTGSLVVALLFVVAACSSSSDSFAATTSSSNSDPNSEEAWCADFMNYAQIARTAILEQVDGSSSLELEQTRIVDNLGEGFLDNFIAGYLELEWKPAHEIGFAAACTAAFDAR